MQFNAVARKQDESIAPFFKRVMAFADSRPVDRFVLDLRLSGGGDNNLLRPIIHGLIRSDAVNRPGKLFTIIGRQTFSAAMKCVNQMKLNTETMFVGEPTASSPNQYGDNAPVVLPNSKLTVRLSTLWWQDMDPRDRRLWQALDLSTELTFAEYRAGRDSAMEAILQYHPEGSVAEIARAAAEKNDYAEARAAVLTFIKNPLHKYASTEFMNANHLDQAILIFKLSVELYPQSANTWDSLGEAFMNQGDEATDQLVGTT